MISVCMATKNGEAFLPGQLASILQQLSAEDEIIVSDDHSTDSTVSILEGWDDARIRLIKSVKSGLIANFENSLTHARGEIIFLADQDDVWLPSKIPTMVANLKSNSLVVCDCFITNYKLEVEDFSFFRLHGSKPGLLRNLWKNSYMGCCMAFHRHVLTKALPFPKGIPMHDQWLGLTAEFFYPVRFIHEPLILHRRHATNASTTTAKSRLTIFQKMRHRFELAIQLFQLRYV